MDPRVSNAFAALSLADADDETLPPTAAAAAATSSDLKPLSSNRAGNGEKGGKISPPVDGKVEQTSGVYRMPLVWIDMEMTGLDVEVDRILEIACIVTDGSLNKIIEGPDLVISQSKECLDRMGEWCQTHHGASGLTKKVLESKVSEKEAEDQVIEFVKRHIGSYTPLLAGNSVYMDFLFLKAFYRAIDHQAGGLVDRTLSEQQKYMPDLASLFSHNIVDVSSVKQLCLRWYPKDYKKAPEKTNKHRAMDDIRESIMELKFYKQNIFKAKPR